MVLLLIALYNLFFLYFNFIITFAFFFSASLRGIILMNVSTTKSVVPGKYVSSSAVFFNDQTSYCQKCRQEWCFTEIISEWKKLPSVTTEFPAYRDT